MLVAREAGTAVARAKDELIVRGPLGCGSKLWQNDTTLHSHNDRGRRRRPARPKAAQASAASVSCQLGHFTGRSRRSCELYAG
jgi:hypothetical protein